MTALVAYQEGFVSLMLLAALFFYPCFDFIVSLLRRKLKGRPLTAPDNDHFHNRLHAFFARRLRSKNLANTMTGLSISGGSSGVVLLLYLLGTISLDSYLWIFVFILQATIYFIIYIYLGARLQMYARLSKVEAMEKAEYS